MKIIKNLGGVFKNILLALLAMALWEYFLSSAVERIYRATINIISKIYSGYLDSIYQDAARDIPDIYLKKIVFLILFIVAIYLIFLGLKNRKWESSSVNKNIEAFSNNMYLIGFTLGLYIIIFSFFALSKFTYSQEVKSYAFHSMEILRPYMGENKYLYLKSQYYQIHSEADFLDFNEALKEESKAHSVTIPNFNPIK